VSIAYITLWSVFFVQLARKRGDFFATLITKAPVGSKITYCYLLTTEGTTVKNRILLVLTAAITFCANLSGPSAGSATAVPQSYVQISTGAGHTCAIAADGSGWCWGSNTYGQLGDGTMSSQRTPVPVSGNHSWMKIVAGVLYTCGLDASDASAWCWGSNASGVLGDGTTDRTSLPRRVVGGQRWLDVTAAGAHTCAVDTTGGAWCWGANQFYGALGDGTYADSSRPVAVAGDHSFTQISGNASVTCAVTDGGEGWCWGYNFSGELGNGSTTSSPVPVPIAEAHVWTGISVGGIHNCGVDTDGIRWCWGYNAARQLGVGSTDLTVEIPTKVAVVAHQTWSSVTAGRGHTCAVNTSAMAWCWGERRFGQRGNGGIEDVTVPVIGGPWTQIAAGYQHTCGLATDQTAWCWGENSTGALGNGTLADSPVPVQIS
jgi:alpha-tubulin suppressor-like RCC1 family protein